MRCLTSVLVRDLTIPPRYAGTGPPRALPQASRTSSWALPLQVKRRAAAPLSRRAARLCPVTTASAPRPRRAAVLVAAAVSALTLTGCSLNSPTTTLMRYAPADGVEIDGEDLVVRDLLVVSKGDGSPAVVSGSLVNRGDEALTVTVTANGETLSQEITVDPNGRTRLDGVSPDGSQGERLVLPALDSPAGQSVEIRLSTGSETLSARAPVLLPRGPYEQFADDAGGTVEPHAESDDH